MREQEEAGCISDREEQGALLISTQRTREETATPSGSATIHNITGEAGRSQWDLTPKGSHFKNASADITCSSLQSHSQRYQISEVNETKTEVTNMRCS